MTAIKVTAGTEHVIKVGTKEYRFTLRPHEVQYFMGLREVGVPPAAAAFMSWLTGKPTVSLADVLEITDTFIGLKSMAFKAELRDVLSTVDKFLKL